MAVISQILGETPVEIRRAKDGSEELEFVFATGKRFRFYHEQDCCESVSIVDICGDVQDLIGLPLLYAEEVTSADSLDDFKPSNGESETWTFYRFANVKGSIVVRWLGESNGYYSESVSYGWIV